MSIALALIAFAGIVTAAVGLLTWVVRAVQRRSTTGAKRALVAGAALFVGAFLTIGLFYSPPSKKEPHETGVKPVSVDAVGPKELIAATRQTQSETTHGRDEQATEEDPASAIGTARPVPAQKRVGGGSLPLWYSPEHVVDYQIASSEDNSVKALVRPISSYTHTELAALPLAERRVFQVVMPVGVSTDQARSTLVQLVLDQASLDPELDAIAAFVHDRPEDAKHGTGFTVASLVWAPGGDVGQITPAIARSNDRSNYAFKIQLMEKTDDPSDRPTPEEFRIYDALEKELWVDPDVPETVVVRRVARELKLSPSRVDRTWRKVAKWKLK